MTRPIFRYLPFESDDASVEPPKQSKQKAAQQNGQQRTTNRNDSQREVVATEGTTGDATIAATCLSFDQVTDEHGDGHHRLYILNSLIQNLSFLSPL